MQRKPARCESSWRKPSCPRPAGTCMRRCALPSGCYRSVDLVAPGCAPEVFLVPLPTRTQHGRAQLRPYFDFSVRVGIS